MKRYVIFAMAAFVGGLLTFRWLLAPRETSAEPVTIEPAQSEQLRRAISTQRIDTDALPKIIDRAEIVLVGEMHFYDETQTYFIKLLERINNPNTVLLLELPQSMQTALDEYMQTGNEAKLGSAWDDNALPYQSLVHFAYQHRAHVRRVIAMDETRLQVIFNRALLTDTRNETMAQAILTARKTYPGAKLIAYGGQLHMLKAGRYRYDDPSRIPVGARLLQYGVAPESLLTIMLGGTDSFALAPLWEQPGAVSIRGDLAKLPPEYFFGGEKIFAANHTGELLDIYVNLGSLTPWRN